MLPLRPQGCWISIENSSIPNDVILDVIAHPLQMLFIAHHGQPHQDISSSLLLSISHEHWWIAVELVTVSQRPMISEVAWQAPIPEYGPDDE